MKIPETRKEIKNFSPYTAGRSIEEVKKEYGLKEVIKLASNESNFGISKKAIKNIKKELDNIFIYPQPRNSGLINKIAGINLVKENMIITGNGTDELIELIAKTFLSAKDNIVVSENSFIRYKMAARLMGAEVREVPRKVPGKVPEKTFIHSPDGLIEAAGENTKIIFIDNPSNPVGTYLNREGVEKITAWAGQLSSPPLIVLDEAYFEYVEAGDFLSGTELLKTEAPIIVLRTFSKIAGLAGLRIGYGISSKEIIGLIERICPPFNTNRLAQAAAIGSLDDPGFIERIFKLNLKEKKFLYSELNNLGVDYIKSATNFILIKLKGADIPLFCEDCLREGLILRPLNGYNLDGYLRVTVGKRKENEKFIELLKKYIVDR